MNQKPLDRFVGIKKQNLTAIKFLRYSGIGSQQIWLFKCDCGNYKEKRIGNFITSSANNCGCLSFMSITKHRGSIRDKNGHQKQIYRAWVQMRQRCNNPKNPDYHYYGGRGIKVCERWNDFSNFFFDMNEKFEKHKLENTYTTLDRIDNNANYSPQNCRWVNRFIQSNNRNFNRKVTYNGKTQTLSYWAKELPIRITSQNLYGRIFGRGWEVKRAFEQPIGVRIDSIKK